MIPMISCFDDLYPQKNGESSLMQLQIQLVEPLPYDLEVTHLDEYKNLRKDWTDWGTVRQVCIDLALSIFDYVAKFS